MVSQSEIALKFLVTILPALDRPDYVPAGIPSATGPLVDDGAGNLLALPAALTSISGLDTGLGLKMLGGRLNIYLRLLRRYAVDHADDMTKLREQMHQGNWDEARRLAHNLKGSSGNLGVSGVQYLASELENEIRHGRDVAVTERLTSAVEIELRRLTAAICAALPEEPLAFAAEAGDWPAARQVLDELEPLLVASSIQANRVIELHAALLKSSLGFLGVELEQRIESFLYDEALEILKRVREEYTEPNRSRGGCVDGQ